MQWGCRTSVGCRASTCELSCWHVNTYNWIDGHYTLRSKIKWQYTALSVWNAGHPFPFIVNGDSSFLPFFFSFFYNFFSRFVLRQSHPLAIFDSKFRILFKKFFFQIFELIVTQSKRIRNMARYLRLNLAIFANTTVGLPDNVNLQVSVT